MATKTTKPWQLRTEVLRLGPSVPEPVGAERQKFHEWIARRFVGSVHIEGNSRATKYLPDEQIRSHPNLLLHFIYPEPVHERTFTIIDCSLNHYQIMSENVLQSLAICAMEFAKSEDEICVIMLASFPHNVHSPFWTTLEDMEASGGSIVVVNNEGTSRLFGRPCKRPRLGADYKRRQREISGTPLREFEDKIIRRMGHFNISKEYCSRFFFDGTRAESELSELLVAEIRQVIGRGRIARTELLISADCDIWMKKAVSAAANLLDMRCVTFPSEPSGDVPRKSVTHVVVLDFINTGETYQRFIDDVQAAGYALHEYAIAAFAAREFHDTNEDHPSVRAIKRVNVERVLQRECDQCQLALPFTNRYQEDLIGLRSYDAWEILLSVNWGPEMYGPPESARLKNLPSFPGIVDKYGDYLAYKLESLLSEVAPKEVAIVCPEEPAVKDLVKKMQPWVDSRIVAVLLPRRVLSATEGASADETRGAGNETEWGMQLSHLSDHKASVVMIDEFNASNATAKQMIKVLSAYQLYPRAYVPIFNFASPGELGNVRVEALYDFPNPRDAWS